jgi:Oligosaccharyltransferase subunit Ribophorin II.
MDINLDLGLPAYTAPANYFAPKAPIEHKFRKDSELPNRSVWFIFDIVLIIPFIVLLIVVCHSSLFTISSNLF